MKRVNKFLVLLGACLAAAMVLAVGECALAQKAPPPPPSPPDEPAPPEPPSRPDMLIIDNGELPNHAPFFYATAAGMKRGYLGVHLTNLTQELRAHFGAPENAGVIVSKIEEGSPAQKGGIKVGDIIVDMDGEAIDSIWKLQQLIAAKGDKDNAVIKIIRDKKKKTLKIKLETRKRAKVDLGPYFQWSWPAGETKQFDIDTEALGEALENLEKNFDNEFLEKKLKERQKKLMEKKDREKELEQQLKELENRIKKLEKKYQTKKEAKRSAKPV